MPPAEATKGVMSGERDRSPSKRRSSLRRISSSTRKSLRRLSHLGHSSRQKSIGITNAEDDKLENMLAQLSDSDKEEAAQSAYSYQRKPDPKLRDDFAKRLAVRIFRSKKNEEKALDKLRATIEFRREKDVANLRLAFADPVSEYVDPLKQHLSTGMLYVSGYDKEGRSTFVFVPRLVASHDHEWTMKQHIYTLERAIACSRSPDQTVNAIVDFKNFSSRQHAPPLSIGKEFMTTLRSYYAGSIHQVFLLDAPTSFFALWSILKPLIGRQTRHKIHFIKSKKNKLAQHYELTEVAEWMTPGGLKNHSFNVDEYLLQTPFDHAFDE